jgi:hypothetical protein
VAARWSELWSEPRSERRIEANPSLPVRLFWSHNIDSSVGVLLRVRRWIGVRSMVAALSSSSR